MYYENCIDLTELEYFDRDENGNPMLVAEGLGPIIDFHTHLGMTYLLARPVDYFKETEQTEYYFPLRGAPVYLELYSGKNFWVDFMEGVQEEMKKCMLSQEGKHHTQTIPNMLRDMDRMGIEKSVVLPVDLAFVSKNTDKTLSCLSGNDRLVPFASLHPLDPRWKRQMDAFLARSARGLKFHPEIQFLGPHSRSSLKMLGRWNETRLPVLFHTGVSGMEIKPMRRFARLEAFEPAIKVLADCPVILGHAGMNDFRKAADYARRYDNVFLEISGQPPQWIRELIDRVDTDRILFGSDYPWYHTMMPMAKVLLGTEGLPEIRRKILGGNAERLLASWT